MYCLEVHLVVNFFILGFIQLLNYSFIYIGLFICWFIHLFIYSIVGLFNCYFIYLLVFSLFGLFIRGLLFGRSFIRLFICVMEFSFIYSVIHLSYIHLSFNSFVSFIPSFFCLFILSYIR